MANYIRHGIGAVRPYLYGVYVSDVDAAHAAAVRAGALAVAAPKDQRYQERSGTLRDRFGNTWYVSTYTG